MIVSKRVLLLRKTLAFQERLLRAAVKGKKHREADRIRRRMGRVRELLLRL